MQAPSGQTTASVMLKDGVLTGEWVLDPGKSSIRLNTRSMWGLAPVKGVFREVSGSGTVSPDGQVSGTITVAAASIDTKNARRDTHLRSADFFDVANHPDLAFAADGIRPYPAPVLRRRGGGPGQRRDLARRRGPRQPGRFRPHLESDGHGRIEQHRHHPRRVHPTVKCIRASWRPPETQTRAN